MGKTKMVRMSAEFAEELKWFSTVTGYPQTTILNTAWKEWREVFGQSRLETLGIVPETPMPKPVSDVMVMWRDKAGNIRSL